MQRGQRAEARGQEGDAKTVRRADAHRAGDVVAFAGDGRARGDHVAFHALGNVEKALAGRRQLAAGGQPAKQFCPQRILECGDAARDGGVVELQPLGRAKDLAGARHGEEDADVIPVHGMVRRNGESRSCAPPSVLPDISPSRGEIGSLPTALLNA